MPKKADVRTRKNILKVSTHCYKGRSIIMVNINSCIGILDLLVFISGIIWPATLISRTHF